MNKGTLVFAQLSEHLPRSVFSRSVSRYAGSYPALSFSHWDQLLCMLFAQFTSRASLRDITMCLRSHSAKLYRAGFRGSIARSTLADANERRDCRIFEEFALHLIGLAREQCADDSLALELEQTVYAIDATNIDLCLSLFDYRGLRRPASKAMTYAGSLAFASPCQQTKASCLHGCRIESGMTGFLFLGSDPTCCTFALHGAHRSPQATKRRSDCGAL